MPEQLLPAVQHEGLPRILARNDPFGTHQQSGMQTLVADLHRSAAPTRPLDCRQHNAGPAGRIAQIRISTCCLLASVHGVPIHKQQTFQGQCRGCARLHTSPKQQDSIPI